MELNFWKCISPIQQLIIPFNGRKNKSLNEMTPELIGCFFVVGFSLFQDFFIFSLGPAATCEVSIDSWAHVLCFPTTCSNWRISRQAPPLFPPTHSTLASRISAHVAPRGRASRTAPAGFWETTFRCPFGVLVGALHRTTTPRSHSIHGRSLWNKWKEIIDWVQWRSQLCSVNHDWRNVSVWL